ncbi:rabenosyn-5-like [Mercenaria mercenaria]|uniref:rabenosyn-5-like n=1 Tax=Mercenaria mercenaria TaxID=6596 RepID=UPI00234F5C5F|nr:rabenosyn-5-like [Mercenaria mercenaria]XP_053377140.1 rabenosyn-5-like [Mercenaria mercenaria]
MSGGEIREGFLCPMCMKDLGTVSQLQSHFEEAHSTEDKATLNQLRGLFDRAKKKFLGDKEGEYVSDTSKASTSIAVTQATSLYDVDYWQQQELGKTRSWTDFFRGLRDARVDKYVVETNKILIRLDKLISSEIPTDSGKRKAFEKTVVMWMPDSEVKSCRYCGRSFSLTRRRHHCRLCGGIMCDRCSHFLTHDYAKKLTNPSFSFEGGRDSGFLKRSGSNSSLNSLFSTEGDPHIRACEDCRKLLERRDQQMEQRNTKSTIVLLYEKMKFCIGECEGMLENYLPMVESLSAGESTYSLSTAQRRRQELVKKYEIIDQISKRIALLDSNKEEGLSPKEALLQKSIRVYASNFMQENMMGLQNLPSEEQYQKLQQKHTAQVQKQIALERQAVQLAQAEEKKLAEKEKYGSPSKDEDGHDRSSSQKHSRNKSDGWKPTEHNVRGTDEDPMLQQMEIIRVYIQQAKQAKKWDEVNMLEQNLRDLQMEYSSQQKQTWS